MKIKRNKGVLLIMIVSIFVDPCNLAIRDFVKASMAGNTDWNDTTEEVAEKLMTGIIVEEHGVPIYKFVNGVVMDRTSDEIAADVAEIPLIAPETSVNTRVDDIENALIEVAGIIADNTTDIDELSDAVIELADIIGG